jgi:hypothetical protein
LIQVIQVFALTCGDKNENADVILSHMEALIPFNAAGTIVFLISMAANAFSLWILLWMAWGKIQIHHPARLLMFFVNCIGILWNIISVVRYYYHSPPSSVLIHYLLGLIVLLGDFMAQFEILKLFHVISGLDQKRMQRLQWFSLVFCSVLGLGTVVRALGPFHLFLKIWDDYGVIISTLFIGLFYLWYQVFLVTKLYQSMQQSTKKHNIKSQNTTAYVQLISKLVLLSLCQYIGGVIWGWGFLGTQNPSQNLTRDRMLVRVGESIGQSHLVLNVLFIKFIKKFTFSTKTSLSVRQKAEEDTIRL